MPGTSVRDAVALVVGELGEGDGLPHLPELPARGPGADLVGRTLGLLGGDLCRTVGGRSLSAGGCWR